MGFLSFTLVALFSAHLSAVLAQAVIATPVPQISGPGNAPDACGGCYIVADVAGIVFGNVTFTQTQQEIVSIVITPNGTNITSTLTSITAAKTPFTIGTGGLTVPGTLSLNFNGPTITVGNVELTSPTQYDVFTAYSLTSNTISNGKCVEVAGLPSTLSTAFSVKRFPGAGADFDRSAEESFITALNLVPTCHTLGGVNSVAMTAQPATIVVVTSSIMAPYRPTLTPQQNQTPTLVTVASTVVLGSVTSTVVVGSLTSTIVVGSRTSTIVVPSVKPTVIKSVSTFKAISTTTIVIVPIVTPLSLPSVSSISISSFRIPVLDLDRSTPSKTTIQSLIFKALIAP